MARLFQPHPPQNHSPRPPDAALCCCSFVIVPKYCDTASEHLPNMSTKKVAKSRDDPWVTAAMKIRPPAPTLAILHHMNFSKESTRKALPAADPLKLCKLIHSNQLSSDDNSRQPGRARDVETFKIFDHRSRFGSYRRGRHFAEPIDRLIITILDRQLTLITYTQLNVSNGI